MIKKNDVIKSDCLKCLQFNNNKIIDMFFETENGGDRETRANIILIIKCKDCGELNKIKYQYKSTGIIDKTKGISFKNWKKLLKKEREF